MLYNCDVSVMWPGWLRWLCCLATEAYPSYCAAGFSAKYSYAYMISYQSNLIFHKCMNYEGSEDSMQLEPAPEQI